MHRTTILTRLWVFFFDPLTKQRNNCLSNMIVTNIWIFSFDPYGEEIIYIAIVTKITVKLSSLTVEQHQVKNVLTNETHFKLMQLMHSTLCG